MLFPNKFPLQSLQNDILESRVVGRVCVPCYFLKVVGVTFSCDFVSSLCSLLYVMLVSHTVHALDTENQALFCRSLWPSHHISTKTAVDNIIIIIVIVVNCACFLFL